MNILITAGGTSEKIDNVRSITNHSTGRLGKAIAEMFLAQGHQVTYVTTPQAVHPTNNLHLALIEIETTKDLESALLTLFKQQTFDSIIHSMLSVILQQKLPYQKIFLSRNLLLN